MIEEREQPYTMTDFKVTNYRIHARSEYNSPEAPFSVVFLSDLHNASYGEDNSRLLQEIINQNPEAVLVSGDMLVAGKVPQTSEALSLMDKLTRRYPVYYVNGNHEQRMRENKELYKDAYTEYSDAIKSLGVHLLENSGARIRIQKMKFQIWGYELPLDYYKRGSKRELLPMQIEHALGQPEDGFFHILLAHHPAYFSAYEKWGADLTLCGHYHGGMIRLPFLGGVVSPQLRLFPEYSRGLFRLEDRSMIVSAGLGSHTIPLRLNNPPELVVIDFIPYSGGRAENHGDTGKTAGV